MREIEASPHPRHPALAAALALLLAALATSPAGGAGFKRPNDRFAGKTGGWRGRYAITRVHVVPLAPGGPDMLRNRTVIVRNGVIESIRRSRADGSEIPAGATVIDGRRRFLIPGLIDSHVHLWMADGRFSDFSELDLYTLFLAHGITVVQEMVGADPQNRIRWQYLDWREEIARGRAVGPTIFVASPRFRDDQQPTFEAIDRAVAEYAAAGFDAIKVHAPNQLANYLRLFDKAAEYGIRPIGHPPFRSPDVPLETVLEHQGMVCHTQLLMFQRYGLGTYDISPLQMSQIAREVEEHGTIIQPTLAINSLYYYLQLDDEWERRKHADWLAYLPPTVTQDWILNNEIRSNPNRNVDRSRLNWTRTVEQTRALHEAGVPLLAGTDAGGLTMSPYGFFFADELRFLVDGVGMTPREALEAATINNARFLGIDDAVGTIEEGKRADLVLLARNPLRRIQSVKRLEGVMVRGRWIGRAELDEAMAELKERMAESRRSLTALRGATGALTEQPCAGDYGE